MGFCFYGFALSVAVLKQVISEADTNHACLR